jgi:hypothetical protein
MDWFRVISVKIGVGRAIREGAMERGVSIG